LRPSAKQRFTFVERPIPTAGLRLAPREVWLVT
jgi:hypothetical protein